MAGDVIVYCERIEVAQDAGPDITDLSAPLGRAIAAAGIRDGSAHVCAVGSTASVTSIEYEPGAIEDLKRAIARLAPPNASYAHELAWHDGNGHSHVQAALLGPSVAVPVRGGRPALGTWQQVVLINHDIHRRRRPVEFTVIGTR